MSMTALNKAVLNWNTRNIKNCLIVAERLCSPQGTQALPHRLGFLLRFSIITLYPLEHLLQVNNMEKGASVPKNKIRGENFMVTLPGQRPREWT